MSATSGVPTQRRLYGNNIGSSSTANLLPQTTSPSPAANSSTNGSPYLVASRASTTASVTDKFAMSPDPSAWGADLDLTRAEPDDYLHNPDPRRDRRNDKGGTICTTRGILNLGCLLILAAGCFTLFAGYPLITFFTTHKGSTFGAFNLGGTNATGQVPSMPGNWALIDADTPKDAYTLKPFTASGDDWQLVFSDEFNVEGRTFYPGDDPYWEAVDLHYWGTNNMEWYDPAALSTSNGSLKITLSKKDTHGLHYQGGMMSTWNKFCFTGGMLLASVTLPGTNNVLGLWPAIWAMGNLGRAGYGASLEGMWPYTYDSCDVGTVKNQSVNGLPVAATVNGDQSYNGVLSFLPGQRLSRCTCSGEPHPGPMHSDGTYVGRAAPEIDVFEAQISGGSGQVSQSGQWAPFNAAYEWFNETNLVIYNETGTILNTYTGGAFQQATSGVTETNQECYELTGACFAVYGFEYKTGFDDAYITWISDNKEAWTLKAPGMAADARVEIAARPVPQEPMYIIMNLGMSENFGYVDVEHLVFPTMMSVDWIRVYQPSDAVNIGCDPVDFPTAAYIEQYIEAYTNPNLTTWIDDYKQPFPKNSFLGEC